MVHEARRRIVVKSRAEYAALRRLQSFLDAGSPKLTRLLVRLWEDEENAITYKELREAILNGDLTVDQWQSWQSDYAMFFNTYLRDTLINAATAGWKDLAAALLSGVDVYAPELTAIENWVIEHGGEWITLMTDQSREAISTLVQYTARGNTTVDELARLIRPLIGLTEPQATANLRYYENMAEQIKSSLLEKNPTMSEAAAEKQAKRRAKESAVRYAARQHRERAQMIARTELAFAYNKGADNAVRSAMNDGLLPKMRKKWSTAGEERVCDICGGLEGVEIEMDDEFDYKGRSLYAGQKRTPPAHPRCRCAIAYIEVE